MKIENFKKEFIDSITHVGTVNALVVGIDGSVNVYEYRKDSDDERLFNLITKKKIEIFEKAPWYLRLVGIKKVRTYENAFIYCDYDNGYHVFSSGNTYYSSKEDELYKYTKNGLLSAIRNKLKSNKLVLVILGDYTYVIEK